MLAKTGSLYHTEPNPEVFMRLSCQKAMMLAALVTIACRESTSPSLAGSFFLASVNGQQLPATVYSNPIETKVVISAMLTFMANGNVVLVERQRFTSPTNATETTATSALKYQLSGNTVTIGPIVCANDLNCVSSFKGELTGSTLSLNLGVSQTTPLIYLFQETNTLAQ
jgi:hypothetical protein